MQGNAVAVARHRYGCRCVERLIEHLPPWQMAELVEEILSSADGLSKHAFGNFVVQHILEFGTEDQPRKVAEVIRSDMAGLVRHRRANHVVRKAILHCSTEDTRALKQAMP